MGRDERARRRQRSPQLCVYCGIQPGTTNDHVPPRALFPKPRPRLITVPCCETCRQAQSLDDEYFKNMTVMRDDVSDEPAGQRMLASVQKALWRPEGRGFATSIVRSLRRVEVRSLAGLHLGYGTTYQVDRRRLDNVMRRTLLGLYFHEVGVRLPDTHAATVFTTAAFGPVSSETEALLREMVKTSTSGQIRLMGDRVFAYAFQNICDVPHYTVWTFLVYNRAAFIGFTALREDLP